MTLYPIDADLAHEQEKEAICASEGDAIVRLKLNRNMKKHKLLEEAMRRFPKGTVARFKSAPKVDHTSDGIFQILDVNNQGSTDVFSGEGLNCFYISHDEEGDFIGEWAVPVADRVFVMTSEDGIPIYERDNVYPAYFGGSGWFLGDAGTVNRQSTVVTAPATAKAFSTLDSAEAWILEQNKPKSVVVDHFLKQTRVEADKIEFIYTDAHGRKQVGASRTGEELKAVYETWLGLQPNGSGQGMEG